MDNFEKRELLFEQLLSALTQIFSESEMRLARELVCVGEPKLALEIIVDMFVEEKRIATSEIISLVNDLAVLMRLDPKIYTDKLENSATHF